MKLKQILLSSVTALTVMVRGANALTATAVVHDTNAVHTDASDSKDQPKPPKDKGDHKDGASDAGDQKPPKPPKDNGDHKDGK